MNADAIIGTMLDAADAEGRLETFAPRAVRDRVAAFALAIGAAYAIIMLVASEWAPFATAPPNRGWMSVEGGPIRQYLTVGFGPFASLMVLEYGMWLLAFVLVIRKFSRGAIAVLLSTVPLLAVIRLLRSEDVAVLQPNTFALIVVALLAVLACVGSPARLHRRVIVVLAAGAATAAIGFLVLSHDPTFFEGRLSPNSTLGVVNAPVFGGLLLTGLVVLAIRRQWAWAVASLVAAAPWLALTVLYFTPLVIGIPLGALVGAACLVAGSFVWRFRGSRTTVARD